MDISRYAHEGGIIVFIGCIVCVVWTGRIVQYYLPKVLECGFEGELEVRKLFRQRKIYLGNWYVKLELAWLS